MVLKYINTEVILKSDCAKRDNKSDSNEIRSSIDPHPRVFRKNKVCFGGFR